MGRLRWGTPDSLLGPLLLACFGCGGGTSSIAPPPPPPQPDFSIAFSPTSVNVQQGTTSLPVSISVSAQNGFTGTVQVTLDGSANGVTSNPASTFGVAAGSSTSVLFTATASAPTGNFTLVASGTSGSLSHSANLSLNVQSGVAANLPRTTFARTDSIPAKDDPPGEPHHRHIVYDPVHQLVFAANRAMNRIDIFSTTNAARVGQVSIPGASSVDLSLDGSTVWVGTVTEQVAAIDASSLQLKAHYEITGLQPIPNTLFDRPEELLTLSSGKVMMRLRQSQTGEALLAIWDPSSNTITNLTSTEPQLFQNGLGSMARTGDHTKVLVAANDASGELAVYDSNGTVLAGPHGLGIGTLPLVAANPDGSSFAVVFSSNGSSQLLLLDGSLNQSASRPTSGVNGMTFSRDGQFLYLSENAPAPSVVTVLDGHDLHTVGQVPDLWIAGARTEIEEADSTKLLFGVSNRGLSFIDAANPVTLPATVPAFAGSPIAQPSEGTNTGGTVTVLAGQNFEPTVQLSFGTQTASSVTVAGNTQINATSPPSATSGAVNLTAYFPSGWLALAPDAFSYGPQVLQILPNAGAQSGGDTIQIYGYGFGSEATKLSVKIGGAMANVQKIENVTTIASSLGLDASYPFSLERITLRTPLGTAGKADVVITSLAGSTTSAKSFQFLRSMNFHARPAVDKFVLYDQKRQWLYLSNVDHVDVFDLAAGVFHANGLVPPTGPAPGAQLRGLALTPDGTQLVVADFAAQNIYLLDPDNGSGSIVAVGGVAGFANSGPSRVAATSTQSVFVGLSAQSSSTGACTACLGQLNLNASPPTIQVATQPEITSLTGAPLVQSNANGDQVFVAFSTAPGGPLAIWNASSPNQFVTFTANDSASDLSAAADGTMFALQANGTTEIRSADLSLAAVPTNPELTQIPGRIQVPGVALHPSGALIYEPFLTGQPGSVGTKGGIDILDAHSGVLRLRLFLPQQFVTDIDGLHGSFLATDENGQRLFALTSIDGSALSAGVTIVTLANVPLGIGTIVPSQDPVAGGTTLTIRGSGFQSASAVTIGGKSAAVTFKDTNTLTVVAPALTAGAQRITITNPDGESISLDGAFIAN